MSPPTLETPTPARPEVALAEIGDSALATALLRLEAVQRRRRELVDRKVALRARERELAARRGDVWRVAADTLVHKRGLGSVEMRDETVLVDQYALLKRDLDAEQRPIREALDVDTAFNRDRRLWSQVIRHERILVRRFVRPQARFVEGLLDSQRRLIGRLRRRSRDARRDRPVTGGLVAFGLVVPILFLRFGLKVQELLFLNVVRAQEALAHTAVDLPLSVKESVEVTREELATQESRRRLRLAIFDQRFLTPERQRVLVFVAACLLTVAYLLSEIVIRAVAPGVLDLKRQIDLVFFYAIGTRTVLPTPFEPILLAAAPALGLVLVVLVAAAGAVVGSWLLFLAGKKATEGLAALGKKRAWIRKSLGVCGKLGPRHGYWMLFLLLSIPFMFDFIAALAPIFRLRVNWFLVVTFFATMIRTYLFVVWFA